MDTTVGVVSPVQMDIAQSIREMGRNFNQEVLKATYDLFVPLHERADKSGVVRHMDAGYGDHERHRLDIFTPEQKPKAPAAVVVYVHGGGYVAGERSPFPGLIYDNVPTFFARNGMIGVNATYRLAPDYKWPCGALDVGAVVAWLRANIAGHGGDPDRVFLMGQSAGATHVAAYSFVEEVHGPSGPGNAGAILLSGVFAPSDPVFSPGPPAPVSIAYYGEDASKWPAMSPLHHVRPGHPPVYIAATEFDPYPLAWATPALITELTKCDKALPWYRLLRDHNHVSSAMQINSEIDFLGPELLEFIASIG